MKIPRLFCGRHVMAVALVVLFGAGMPAVTHAAGNDSDVQARSMVRQMTDFLTNQKKFSVDTRSTLEVVLDSGQKIQFAHAARLSVQRPDRMRAERAGELVDQVFYYDGKSLTLYNPDDKFYATVPAPGTLEEMLDFARESLDIVAPAGDLIYANAYDILMQDVESGLVVGKAVIEGARCNHLAFRAPQVDWQIWIQEGAQPLPRKLVITSRDIVNAPQFAVTMTKWERNPRFNARTFSFTPSKDARKVDFLPASAAAK